MTDGKLLDAGEACLRKILDSASGFQLDSSMSGAQVGAQGVDAVWRLRSDSDEACLLIEAKTNIWPRDVAPVSARLKAAAAALDADGCVLVAPRVTERTRDLLQRAGVDYIDLRGQVRVVIPGRLLIVAQGAQQAPGAYSPDRNDRIVNPFRGKASRIVRALLAEPQRWWGVTELAECVGVSAGLSVKTLKTLERNIYVRRDQDRRVTLADGEALLRQWAAVVDSAFRNAGRFVSRLPDPDEVTRRLSSRLESLGVRYAVSRLAAARFIEPYAPARVVDIYVDRDPGDLAEPLGLLPVDRGETVRLVRPGDEGVFQFCGEYDTVTVVSPVQLFIDLSNGRGRDPDVAERLFENSLRETLVGRGEP
ncbi:MAG: hypothetical protein F4Z72_10345 [Gemmatimonadales bacterium]|uniref:hypothetical protein n=1 Tax=Candidatus Palauibacter irciniicola TaxID=3056733 RepID=UPI0013834CA1|nr:hypothetical protein [Candidatus Palauibacter irciniicola]MYC17885.1 hypothetical protein [Gemmatimonadales bacterium]